jgi:hypothetical protein
VVAALQRNDGPGSILAIRPISPICPIALQNTIFAVLLGKVARGLLSE